MNDAEEQKLLEDIATRLRGRHEGVPPQVVESIVGSAYVTFGDAQIRDFVPVLVERRAASQLAGLATS
ncbi:hypothetical protein JGU71_24525 [Antrihabitans sp. YC3-6]|uniref:DUF3562 domain-containing protein n=1 Tax=Antrihabitans stalagmiti TaxID=2799499 RepID=A0A934U601_9NOCA|nr:hypothetical protein [Antrihabitans stalagmiti]MBJ8342059.1 hypothetical protein [Antrihabitans stalagmiti]